MKRLFSIIPLIFAIPFFAFSAKKAAKLVEGETYQGTVLYFDKVNGYGYITESTTEHQVFVHEMDIYDEIENNDHVTFRVYYSTKGARAYDVLLVGTGK